MTNVTKFMSGKLTAEEFKLLQGKFRGTAKDNLEVRFTVVEVGDWMIVGKDVLIKVLPEDREHPCGFECCGWESSVKAVPLTTFRKKLAPKVNFNSESKKDPKNELLIEILDEKEALALARIRKRSAVEAAAGNMYQPATRAAVENAVAAKEKVKTLRAKLAALKERFLNS